VRPRFFCGQLLTDQDLEALVRWTRDRFRLARYRDGWGVVCGLEVRCDHQRPGSVVVAPGYAVSCCGDDILVCADTVVDLSACLKDAAACEHLPPREPDETGPVDVDLFVAYDEQLIDPEPALVRSSCTDVAACEFGRVDEHPCFTWRRAEPGADPLEVAARRWQADYDQCLVVVRKFKERFPAPAEHAQDALDWLAGWVAKHPLSRFCWLWDRLAELREREEVGEADLAAVLFWIVQDCRSTAATCRCHQCQDGPGIPLARVRLRPPPPEGGPCTVYEIDPYPPYRRPLSRTCWPAPLGSVNVGRFTWQRPEGACTGLAELGLPAAELRDVAMPRTVEELEDLVDCDPFVACGERPVVKVLEVEGGRRVVAVCEGARRDLAVAPA
jgi:hypothetical protein